MTLDAPRHRLTFPRVIVAPCPSCSKPNRFPAARMRDRARCAACKSSILPLAKPLAVHSAEELEEIVWSAPMPVLVDFWAWWCGPCRIVAPELDAIARERAGRVVVAKVDTEQLPKVAGRFGIRSIPTMILFRGGREVHRVAGAMPASAIADGLGLS